MAKEKPKNMEEFAGLVGISRPTLSKYFYDPDSVRPKTRDKIEAALEHYDYRPNIFAMNQNRKLTKNVGIVVPYLADPFFAEIARNIEQQCIDAGHRPSLFSSYGDPALEVDILDTLRSLKPAGVLLAPLGRNSNRAAVEKFCAEVPSVLFDSNVDDVGLAFVGSDNAQFAALIVDYLCRTGSPPCFFEMRNPANPNANKRRAGYVAAMERLGHAPQIVQVDGEGWAFEEIGRREGIKAIEEKRFATDTVLCSNDRLAIGFLTACYEKGLRVGRASHCAIRVAGQDDHPFSRFTCPPLTTIAQDYAAISARAVETLFRMIDEGGSGMPRDVTLFEGKLVMRDSA
ncbi:LacI family DNA-binding transcriptional regulator [Defluviimonas sp. D31]|uniref:LacI family DNA-binding transcriptional regulator n=1 Tax=Defluviimonas sp. D31 TaxID=3083253 RepID=UPI00296E6070|nr:LacI family DNA-binding transcriptional regulator [Defluviimonas sp. D31]MDW4548253.1 LacI family DNA-binding transcriptional regulator [Defluviimonas sp. D31]